MLLYCQIFLKFDPGQNWIFPDFETELPLNAYQMNWNWSETVFRTSQQFGIGASNRNLRMCAIYAFIVWMLLRLMVLERLTKNHKNTQETCRRTSFEGALNNFFWLRSNLTEIASSTNITLNLSKFSHSGKTELVYCLLKLMPFI